MAVESDAGYRALRERAAWLDLSNRGELRITGEDRTRLLHAMTSNHVEQLRPGQGCYAFFLNAQGRILADLNLLCFPDFFLLDTEPETRRKVIEHLENYIIADDVSVEDVTGETFVLGVEGPQSAGILSALGAPCPEEPWSHAAWGTGIVARLSATGEPAFRIFAPAAERAELVRGLEQAGAVAAAPEEARTVRLETGKPRYGEDMTEKHLPHETQLLHAVHFNKGCYLGQEIVERVRSRGLVHRLLVRLELDAALPLAPGTPVEENGKPVGEITSAAFSPAAGKVVALGYVRREQVGSPAPLTAGGAPVRIVNSEPAG